MTSVRLHVPDEPVARAAEWRDALRRGVPVDDVVLGWDGVAEWFWSRWRSLERHGVDHGAFVEIGRGHARELALWLRGERPYRAAAASFAGRLERRVPQAALGVPTPTSPRRVLARAG